MLNLIDREIAFIQQCTGALPAKPQRQHHRPRGNSTCRRRLELNVELVSLKAVVGLVRRNQPVTKIVGNVLTLFSVGINAGARHRRQ